MKDAELAILSIIAEAPITGYDIQAVIDQRNLRLWTLVGVESLYYVIEKLEKQGLIVNIDEKPAHEVKHRLYRVTPAGIGVLQTAVTDLLSSPQLLPRGLELGLANLPVLKTSQAFHALQHYRSALQSRYDAVVQQLEQIQQNDAPFHIVSMFEHRIVLYQAEMAWFDEWFETWQAQAPPEEEPAPREPAETPRMQQVVLPDDPDSFHKHATRQHNANDIEFPPPPQKRSRSAPDETRVNNPTPPHIDKKQ